MAYENLGGGALDYFPCRYGNSKLLFRGPKQKLDSPYVAVLGGSETYGKFIEQPYPALLAEALGFPVVNFGCMNAGNDVFVHDQTIIELASRAEVAVIQLTGAHNMSNRFYAVHPRRNDRFLRAANLLKTIYREVDFTEFNFTRHLLTELRATSEEKFAMVEQELREAWIARMKTLISKIGSRIVLLWMSDHTPGVGKETDAMRAEPLFVSKAMIDEVRPFVSDVIEVTVSPEDVLRGQIGMVFSELEVPAARNMLGTVAHQQTAAALEGVLRTYLHTA